jgi:hypothetical protein
MTPIMTIVYSYFSTKTKTIHYDEAYVVSIAFPSSASGLCGLILLLLEHGCLGTLDCPTPPFLGYRLPQRITTTTWRRLYTPFLGYRLPQRITTTTWRRLYTPFLGYRLPQRITTTTWRRLYTPFLGYRLPQRITTTWRRLQSPSPYQRTWGAWADARSHTRAVHARTRAHLACSCPVCMCVCVRVYT